MRALAIVACLVTASCVEPAAPDVDRAASAPVQRSAPESSAPAPVTTADRADELERACDEGSSRACVRLADLLERGDGTTADPERARALLEQACQAGSTDACDRLGH